MRRIVKKTPQADAVDPERWLAGTPERASGPQSWRLLRAIAEAVLPQPQSQIGLFTLWGSVSTDFVLLFMGFIAASQTRFGLRLFFGLSVDPARSVALPFSRGYLGLVLVYGALVTLLGYVEGLYSADPDRSTQAQVVVLGKAICWPTVLIGAAIRISSQRARWNHLDVKVIPDLFGCELPHLGFEHIGRIPVISLHHEPLR